MHPIIEKVKATIKINNLIQFGDHIVVGVSGGPDSVCLLHILHCLGKDLNCSLIAVHVNHMLRPGDADKDQQFVEEFCEALDIPCRVFFFDIPEMAAEGNITSEEAGREARYQAFHEIKKEVGAQKIAVAQNMNDQAETLLMRILRGTGTDGLAGMDHIRDQVLIRPLLDVSRSEIEAYCRDNGLNPRTDRTNFLPIYTRNKIRLELIPYLQAGYNGNIIQGLNRLANIAREDKDYIYKTVDQVILENARAFPLEDRAEGIKKTVVPCAVLNAQHPAVCKRILVKIFASMGLIQDIQSVHLDQALKIIKNGSTSLSMEFPGGYSLRITYGNAEFLGIRTKPTAPGNDLTGDRMGILKESLVKAEEFSVISDNSCRKYFDFDSIQESGHGLVLRTRMQGDYFSPLGMKGSKKIKAFFIDEKVPREIRDEVPLVCLGSEILWIVGYRISEKYKITPQTKKILMLEYSRVV